jgi:hypothetical protein
MDETVANTDRELWREPAALGQAAYAPSIHVTARGGIGIDVGGDVYVKPLREWHRLAVEEAECVRQVTIGKLAAILERKALNTASPQHNSTETSTT